MRESGDSTVRASRTVATCSWTQARTGCRWNNPTPSRQHSSSSARPSDRASESPSSSPERHPPDVPRRRTPRRPCRVGHRRVRRRAPHDGRRNVPRRERPGRRRPRDDRPVPTVPRHRCGSPSAPTPTGTCTSLTCGGSNSSRPPATWCYQSPTADGPLSTPSAVAPADTYRSPVVCHTRSIGGNGAPAHGAPCVQGFAHPAASQSSSRRSWMRSVASLADATCWIHVSDRGTGSWRSGISTAGTTKRSSTMSSTQRSAPSSPPPATGGVFLEPGLQGHEEWMYLGHGPLAATAAED